jgi:LysM repeat protein
MSGSARRTVILAVGVLLLAVGAGGCTLAGASAAPLTPVEPGEVVEPADTGEEQIPSEEEVIPTPTEVAPIDVFGTQTAMAPAPEGEEGGAEGEATPEPAGEGEGEAVEATPEPAETEEATEAPATQAPAASGDGCPATYTIQAGDTLFSIAQRCGLTVDQLASANGISNPNQLSIGQELTVPTGSGTASGGDTGAASGSGSVHVVQPGENLFRIALQYGLTYQELANYNNITDPASISVGQEIQIP